MHGFNPPDWRDAEALAAAGRFVALRAALWRSLLAFVPAAPQLCALARAALARELCPTAALEQVAAAARALIGGEGAGRRGEFEAARRAAAELLGPADPDELLCDWIVADLTDLELGQAERVAVRLSVSPRSWPRFVHYLSVVRLHRYALSAARAALTADDGRVLDVARALGGGSAQLERLIAAGRSGLRRAVGRFDPRRGVRFASVASWWIGRTIRGCLGAPPRGIAAEVRAVAREFVALHGRRPLVEELAGLTGVPLARVRGLIGAGGRAGEAPRPAERADPADPSSFEDPAIERLRAYLRGRGGRQ